MLRDAPPPWSRLRTLSRLGRLLYVCRVPLLTGGSIALLGWQVEQIHEIIRADVIDIGTAGHRWRSASHLVACWMLLANLSMLIVGWSRYAIAHRFPMPLAHNRFLRAVVDHLPAAIACLPWIGALLATLGARHGLADQHRGTANSLLVAVGAFGIFALVSARGSLQVEPSDDGRYALQDPTIGRFLFRWSLGLGTSLFLLAVVDPWLLGRWLGTIDILLAAATGAMPLLTWLTAAPRMPRWHWLSLIAGVAIVFSAFDLNDNHPVRALDDPADGPRAPGEPAAPPRQAATMSIHQAFERWLAARPAATADGAVPVVLVAAEGGGIRAAYFTALVLAVLQDRCPAFAHHVFAISGVSGGSVGAAVFHALVADEGAARRPDTPPPALADCAPADDAPAETRASSGLYVRAVESVLREDLLAPLTATALFPDAVQRLLFWPIDGWDRAVTLERSLEKAYAGARGRPTLERSLYRTWWPESDAPLLLLNATRVDSGERVVASPVLLLDERFHRVDTLADLAPFSDVRISTAAMLSARFTYVTPAAYLHTGQGKMRLVDGGYFENSGSATLDEMLTFVTFQAAQVGRKVLPIVIRIGNAPISKPGPGAAAPATGLGELLSPVRTMFATRAARGQLAAEALKSRVTGMLDDHRCAEHVEFRIDADDVVLPLGWQLAQATREALQRQFDRRPACDTRDGVVNACAVQDLMRALHQPFLCEAPAPR